VTLGAGKRWARIIGAAVLLAAPMISGIASAEEDAPGAEEIKRAGAAFDHGKRAYRNEEWVDAAEQFEIADTAAPSAAALELAIRSRERANQLDRAAGLAALALDRYSDQQKLVKLANDVLKKAAKALHKLSVACDHACDLLVDSKLVHGRSSTERTIYLVPGDYSVRASWSGDRSRTEKVTASKGGSSELSFTAPPLAKPKPEAATPVAPAPEPTPAPSEGVSAEASGGWSPVVFFIGTGLTLAAGAVTTWSGIDTQNNPGADRVREECAGQGESCPLYQEGLDKQRRTNILAGITAGLGVTTIVIGLFATDWGGSEKPAARARSQRAGIEPWLGIGQGASVGAQGRF
jgi:hypothetical protein